MAAEEERGRVHRLSKTIARQMKYDLKEVSSHGYRNAICNSGDSDTLGKVDVDLIETYQISRSHRRTNPEPGT